MNLYHKRQLRKRKRAMENKKNNSRGYNRVLTERYFSGKVHVIPIEEVPVQTTLCDGASFRRLKFYRTKIFTSAFKFRAKYSHINL